jgi:hypothetical protein
MYWTCSKDNGHMNQMAENKNEWKETVAKFWITKIAVDVTQTYDGMVIRQNTQHRCSEERYVGTFVWTFPIVY